MRDTSHNSHVPVASVGSHKNPNSSSTRLRASGSTSKKGSNQTGNQIRRGQPRAAATNPPAYVTDSSEDDEADWDFGVGNLVIDLDADIEKSKLNTSTSSSSTENSDSIALSSTTGSPPATVQLAGGAKMSSVEHQATVDRGLKMKIKRKNIGAGTKVTDTKHEIVKAGEKATGSGNSSTLPQQQQQQQQQQHIQDSNMDTSSSSQVSPTQDVGIETCSIGTVTDSDFLGPCDPGTAVTLEGIVWHETTGGVLVVNVTWREKTYVGTLLDATKHDWAPPRLNCDSPTSDMERQTPKGRGKRRAAANLNMNENQLGDVRKLRKGGRRNNSGTFTAPPSPAKSESGNLKRKGRDLELLNGEGPRAMKRSRSNSRGTPTNGRESPVLIECPEPNCNKKYRHINGLRYHQTHAHQNNEDNGDEKEDSSEESTAPHSPGAASVKSDKPVAGKTRSRKNAAAAAATNAMDEDDTQSSPPTTPRKQKEESVNSNSNTPSKGDKSKLEAAKTKDIETNFSSASNKKTPASVSSNDTVSSVNSEMKTNNVVQISATAIGLCTAVVTATSQMPGGIMVTTTGNALTPGSAVTAIPVAVTNNATIVSVQDAKLDKDDKVKRKGEKAEKKNPKSTVAARPIMPAPPVMSHAGLAPVSIHAQQISAATASLKPIQPKPTILGEPSTVNPALTSLKEKKTKKKKVPTATLR